MTRNPSDLDSDVGVCLHDWVDVFPEDDGGELCRMLNSIHDGANGCVVVCEDGDEVGMRMLSVPVRCNALAPASANISASKLSARCPRPQRPAQTSDLCE
jgi:hypothetical protein